VIRRTKLFCVNARLAPREQNPALTDEWRDFDSAKLAPENREGSFVRSCVITRARVTSALSPSAIAMCETLVVVVDQPNALLLLRCHHIEQRCEAFLRETFVYAYTAVFVRKISRAFERRYSIASYRCDGMPMKLDDFTLSRDIFTYHWLSAWDPALDPTHLDSFCSRGLTRLCGFPTDTSWNSLVYCSVRV
jgi:hypothetical protein